LGTKGALPGKLDECLAALRRAVIDKRAWRRCSRGIRPPSSRSARLASPRIFNAGNQSNYQVLGSIYNEQDIADAGGNPDVDPVWASFKFANVTGHPSKT